MVHRGESKVRKHEELRVNLSLYLMYGVMIQKHIRRSDSGRIENSTLAVVSIDSMFTFKLSPGVRYGLIETEQPL